MRSNQWLEKKLDNIWTKHFCDVEKINNVHIKFGKKARCRLGSIRQYRGWGANQDSIITLTGFFKDERVPEFIIDSTIAHELCHYAHGFSSPHPQLYKHPHSGGRVDNELEKRGFSKHLMQQKLWLKEEWPKIIGKRRRIYRRRITIISPMSFLFRKYQ